MKPRLSVLTICVDDLERALRFYRDGLGLQTPGIIGEEFEYGAVVFFDLQPGLKLVGLNRFTLRGKRKVNTQWLLYCLVHNIGKIYRYAPGWR